MLSTANGGDLSLILMKFNNIGEYVAYQGHNRFEVEQFTAYKNDWNITSHARFWTPQNIATVKLLSTMDHIRTATP
jgi:hypothetical protein